MSLVQFPWSVCRSVLGQDTEPQTAPGRHVAWQPPPSVHETLRNWNKLIYSGIINEGRKEHALCVKDLNVVIILISCKN